MWYKKKVRLDLKQCMYTVWKNERLSLTTVWQFHNFSITRILRVINFGDFRSAKIAVSAILEALNFANLANIGL